MFTIISNISFLSIMTPEPGLVIWMLIAFVILFLILAKWGWPIITGMAEKRSNFINESMKSAKEANERLADIKLQAEDIINDAKNKQIQILKDAAESRDKILETAKIKAEEETERMLNEARIKLQIERENLLNELRTQVADLSVQIAEKVIRKELSQDVNQRIVIDKMLDDILKMN